MMKTKILMVVLVSLLVILVVSPRIPAGNKVAERGQDAGKGAKAPPEIESITFIFYRYPAHVGPGPHPDAETDTYHFIKGGLHWSSFPVEYEVDPTGSGVADADAIAAAEAGFEEWDIYDPVITGSEGFFDRVESSSNSVSWGTIDGTGGAVAMASVSFLPWSKEIQSFKIVFDKDETWDIYGAPVPTWPYTGEVAFDIQNVAAHEVGHVVGLDHVNAPKDGLLTLYRYTTEGETIKRELGSGDKFGVVDLYD
jgi:hypothetical protein